LITGSSRAAGEIKLKNMSQIDQSSNKAAGTAGEIRIITAGLLLSRDSNKTALPLSPVPLQTG
jgi:hypothetical protein